MLLIATALGTSTTDAHVIRVPHRCHSRIAPIVCAISFHHWRTEVLRARLGYPARGFRRDPSHVHGAARARLLSRWVRRHAVWKHRWHEAERARAASPVAIITSIFGSEAPSAIAVARCESGLDPRAHNPSGAAGLFQLMPSHWQSQGYDPYDAATNTRIARALYDAVGWSAWVCQP